MAIMDTESTTANETLKPDPKLMDELTGGDAAGPAFDEDGDMGTYEGGISMKDMGVPTLAIAYGVGGLAQDYAPGDLVLDKQHKLTSKGEALRFIIIKASKYYKEWLDKESVDAGIKPNTCKTIEEVVAAGGSLEWDNTVSPAKPPTYSDALAVQMLIQKPEAFKAETCDMFGIQLSDGKLYAPAKFYIDKTGFKPFNQGIARALGMHLKAPKNLLHGMFEVKVMLEVTKPANGKPSRTKTLPYTQLVGINPPELVSSIMAATKLRPTMALPAANKPAELTAGS